MAAHRATVDAPEVMVPCAIACHHARQPATGISTNPAFEGSRAVWAGNRVLRAGGFVGGRHHERAAGSGATTPGRSGSHVVHCDDRRVARPADRRSCQTSALGHCTRHHGAAVRIGHPRVAAAGGRAGVVGFDPCGAGRCDGARTPVAVAESAGASPIQRITVRSIGKGRSRRDLVALQRWQKLRWKG